MQSQHFGDRTEFELTSDEAGAFGNYAAPVSWRAQHRPFSALGFQA